MPTPTDQKLGWIGTGRMGYAMAERLAKGGCDIAVWNRTKAKADPLSKYGARVVNQLEELSTKDILFVMVSTYDDVKERAIAAGAEPAPSSPEAFAAYIRAETKKWGEVVRAAGVKLQ